MVKITGKCVNRLSENQKLNFICYSNGFFAKAFESMEDLQIVKGENLDFKYKSGGSDC